MSICAVIVSFYPTEEIIENVNKLVDQVDKVVIIDNGSDLATKELFGKFECHSKISVVYIQENLGIAAALNIGVKKAQAEGHQWVATFDQDSQATVGMIETMLEAYEIYPQKEKIISLSPRYKDKNNGLIRSSQLITSHTDAAPYAEAQEVITSGNLLKLSVFDSIGYFNEALFIDYVDIEYCLRCITQGYKILEVKDAVLVHSIGFPTYHKVLWKTPTVSHHSALRRYYFARNAIYTYKKFAFKQPIWVIKNAYILVKMMALIVLFEADRKKKMAAVFRGLVDGLFGRMGKCSTSI